ncbi:hypothetical protein DFAR_3610004 [Desulfarculales bacterium]
MTQNAPEVRLLTSLLAVAEAPRVETVCCLLQVFGTLEFLVRLLAFILTRRLASFRRLVAVSSIAEIKRACQTLEADLARGCCRMINLGPDLLCADSLALASDKPQGHLLALAPGV